MAKDMFHGAVRSALESDGWEITHDPYTIKTLGTSANIDLGAEKLIAAQRDKDYIAVEIKSFANPSFTYDFHLALGQYMNYLRGLRQVDPGRRLYLAVPNFAYESFFIKSDVWEAVQEFGLNLIVFDDQQQTIIHWFENSSNHG